uniref:RNA1 polyprotein n=1 Tax=Grapevine fabavirus TaxID=1849838 RepID=A0A679DXW0_9SECO|nr:polyprotein [Grapevine fabavirus]
MSIQEEVARVMAFMVNDVEAERVANIWIRERPCRMRQPALARVFFSCAIADYAGFTKLHEYSSDIVVNFDAERLCLVVSHMWDAVAMEERVAFINMFFKYSLNMDIEYTYGGQPYGIGASVQGPYMSSTPCSGQLGQAGLLVKLKEFSACLSPSSLLGWVKGGIDKFWGVLKDLFIRSFGSYFPSVTTAFRWMQESFTSLRGWSERACAVMAKWCDVFSECALIGLAITSITCCLHLFDRLLVAAGIFPKTVGLATFFSVAAIGSLCGVALVGSFCEGAHLDLANLCLGHCKLLLVKLYGIVLQDQELAAQSSQTQNGQNQFSDLLGYFGESLHAINAKTIKEANMLVGSFHNFKQGFMAIKDLTAWIFENLSEFALQAFGIESTILSDLSVIIGYNLTDWLEEADNLVARFAQRGEFSRELLDKVRVMKQQARKLMGQLLEKKTRPSVGLVNVIQKAQKKLEELEVAATLAGNNIPRKKPFWIHLTGKAGVGKSTVMQRLVTEILEEHLQDPVADRYSRNAIDCYWSGYRRQFMVTYDDLGAIECEPNEEQELIKLVSTDPVSLNMASLAEKGMKFDSRFIVSSGNFAAYSPHAKIHDSDAYCRRRDLLIEVCLKPDVAYDPADFTANQMYLIRDPKHYMTTQTFDCYEELKVFIQNSFENQDREQEQLLRSTGRGARMGHGQMRDLLDLLAATAFLAPMPLRACQETMMEQYRDEAVRYLCLQEDGLAQFLVGRRIEIVDAKLTPEERQRVDEFDASHALSMIQLARANSHLEPFMATYAWRVVKECLIDEKLQPTALCRSVDPCLAAMIESCAVWHKILLRKAALVYRSEKRGGWFSSLICDFKDSVKKLFALEFSQWPMSLKMAVGVVCASFVGYGIYKLLAGLWETGTGLHAATAVSTVMMAQSVKPNRGEVTEYRFRNIPVTTRRWERGQADFQHSAHFLMEKVLANVSYGSRDAMACILPGHQLVGVAHFYLGIPDKTCLEVVHDGRKRRIFWRKSRVEIIPNSELVVYRDSSLPLVASSVDKRVIYDPESELPKLFSATFASCKYVAETQCYVPEIGKIEARIVDSELTILAGDYVRKIFKSISYDVPTIDHDCGSLILVQKEGSYSLAGLHVSGSGKSGSACFIPVGCRLSNMERGQSVPLAENLIEEEQMPVVIGPNLVMEGFMKEELCPKERIRSQFVETPVAWHLGVVSDKVPSIIGKKDERLKGTAHENFNPYAEGMKKYAREAGPFDAQLAEAVFKDIEDTWHDCSEGFTFEEATLEEAITGIEGMEYFDSLVVNTSEGYPFVLEREQGDKGKLRYLELNGEQMSLIPGTSVEKHYQELKRQCGYEVPEIIGLEKPKDERVVARKVFEKPKTRLFTVLPMSYNLLVRQKFIRFVRFYMKQRDKLVGQVGINPYGRQWHVMAERLLEKGNAILCCDYSLFDGILPSSIMGLMADCLNNFMGGTDREKSQRKNLLLACTERKGIAGKMLYTIGCGIPSGFPLTVILNSIFNEFLVRYIYRSIAKDNELGALVESSFDQFVTMVAYGDDNLISVAAPARSWFNGETLKTAMQRIGIVITDGVDKTLPTLAFRELQRCDFLKRGFVLDRHGRWRAPLERESLYAQLTWVKDKNLTMKEAYLTNLESVLRELYLHSYGECDALRKRALQLKNEDGALVFYPGDVPNLARIEAFYCDQWDQKAPFALSADLMLSPTLLGSFENPQVEIDMQQIVPDVCVVSRRMYSNRAENDFAVMCMVPRARLAPSDPMKEVFFGGAVGSGRGGLPSFETLQSLTRAKSDICKKITTALNSRRRVVFVADTTVLASIYAVLYLGAVGKLKRDDTNYVLSQAICHAQSLRFLPEFFPQYF